jgi:hypothetical protein
MRHHLLRALPKGAGDPLWTPAETTTWLWLDSGDAESLALSGNKVTTWQDKSGNSNHFAQGTDSLRPLYSPSLPDGLPGLEFAGSCLTSTTAKSLWAFLNSNTGSTFYAVAKMGLSDDPSADYSLFGSNLGAGGTGFVMRGICFVYMDNGFSNRYYSYINTGAAIPMTNAQGDAWTPNAYSVFSARSNAAGTAANRQIARFNGGAAIANNVSTSLHNTNAPLYDYQVGAAGNNALLMTGVVREIVLQKGYQSLETVERFEGYFAHKWNLAGGLSSDHPYKNAAPTL